MPWTTPGTATAGSVLTASFLNTNLRDNMLEFAPLFAAWTSYTPQIDQGATTNIAKTVTYARYVKVGRLAIVQFRLDVTGTGSAGANLVVSLPAAVVPVGAGANGPSFGYGAVYDSSASTNYSCSIRATATTQIAFAGDWSGVAYWGTSPNIAIAASDQLHCTYICETTS